MPPPGGWDFEAEPKPARPAPVRPAPAPQAAAGERPSPPPPASGAGAGARTVQVRRRRAAAVVAALVLAVVIGVASGSHGSRHHAASGARARVHAAPKAPTDPEKDELRAVSSTLAYTPFVRECGTKGRHIALTFDDGPGPYTPQVLSLLERVQATPT